MIQLPPNIPLGELQRDILRLLGGRIKDNAGRYFKQFVVKNTVKEVKKLWEEK